jgi:hypothetical protein
MTPIQQFCAAMRAELQKLETSECPTNDRQASGATMAANIAGECMPETKEWEIFQFRQTEKGGPSGLIFKLWGNGKYGLSDGVLTLKNMLYCVASGHFEIFSVRRLLDGEVFTLGDVTDIGRLVILHKVNDQIIATGETKDFRAGGNLVALRKPIFTTSDGVALYNYDDIVYHKTGPCSVEYALDRPDEYYSKPDLVPKRESIGTTVDGVKLFKGDTVYLTCEQNNILTGLIDSCRVFIKIPEEALRYAYSTSEAAEKAYEKWLRHQPVITLNDIIECGQVSESAINKLRELAIKKLEQ